MNIVVETLIELKTPLTVSNYLQFAYFGDVRSLDQLAEDFPEDYCELLGLIEDGIIVDTKSGSVN